MATTSLTQQVTQQYEAARRANEMRYAQAMSIYDEIIKRYEPGGTFGQAALGQLEKQKVRDVGQETQQMISSGLYGTTTTAGLPGKWEAEVGAPSRLRLEDLMMERLSQAQVGKAGFIERREDVYPDVGAIAEYEGMMAQAEATKYASQQQTAAGREQTKAQQKMQQEQFAQQSYMQQQQQHAAKMEAWRAGGITGGTSGATTPTATPTAAPTYGQAAQPTPEQAAGVPTSLAVGTQMKSMLSGVGTDWGSIAQQYGQKVKATGTTADLSFITPEYVKKLHATGSKAITQLVGY